MSAPAPGAARSRDQVIRGRLQFAADTPCRAGRFVHLERGESGRLVTGRARLLAAAANSNRPGSPGGVSGHAAAVHSTAPRAALVSRETPLRGASTTRLCFGTVARRVFAGSRRLARCPSCECSAASATRRRSGRWQRAGIPDLGPSDPTSTRGSSPLETASSPWPACGMRPAIGHHRSSRARIHARARCRTTDLRRHGGSGGRTDSGRSGGRRYRLLTAGELDASADPALWPSISSYDLRLWKPKSLGEALFNYWDWDGAERAHGSAKALPATHGK